jgi:signal transduction histidine kinase
MLFLSTVVAYFLKNSKKLCVITIIALGVCDLFFFVLPMLSDVYFYDIWPYWAALQAVSNIILLVCLIKGAIRSVKNDRWLHIGMMLPLIAFGTDAAMTALGGWQGGIVSGYVFCGLFIVALIFVLRIIPRNINAAAKAKELETEKNALYAQLAQSRISTMMSQIRPHFIYNTLGSIEQLCNVDPPKAGKLVDNFAMYLRGNIGELDNPRPIRMSQEMEHVRYYVSIESVRFPDMTFTFDMKSEDFMLPALSIQPIVENAIKHGLMSLDRGGSVHVTSWETPTSYCVSIEDDGVGFDTGILFDERKHIGLRNIRERLEATVNGTLTIESTPGKGTKVQITIPKDKA